MSGFYLGRVDTNPDAVASRRNLTVDNRVQGTYEILVMSIGFLQKWVTIQVGPGDLTFEVELEPDPSR